MWNTPVRDLPVDPNADACINAIGATTVLHADFATALDNGALIGIPYVTVPADQPKLTIVFAGFADEPKPFVDESHPGPAPIPADAPIVGGWNAVATVHFYMESISLRLDG